MVLGEGGWIGKWPRGAVGSGGVVMVGEVVAGRRGVVMVGEVVAGRRGVVMVGGVVAGWRVAAGWRGGGRGIGVLMVGGVVYGVVTGAVIVMRRRKGKRWGGGTVKG
ncbi:hypothetical protein [Nonomuraea endophytica]|uniref:Uncharacterized protein n=1 Tax=Nonomuraea endophytica TaxID=714136 RepID=A0A7W8ELN2_9ACTN|nr:hypothetical protein [Nonomuraea endophytica]MBB5083816.1 hypothetical protein [Nonomuraea endophytica]